MGTNTDKHVILSAADGPEGIEIYTSEEEGVVDWSPTSPAMYLVATVNGAMVKLGPFGRGVWDQLLTALQQHPTGVVMAAGASLLVEHGHTCQKMPHELCVNYNHATEYDGDYIGVDEKRHCGRCHKAL